MRKANTKLLNLITRFRKSDKPSLRSVAEQLARPTRQLAAVNVSKLDRICKENEDLAVPGKVLGFGEISKPVNVYALNFSKQAIEKIKKAGGKCKTLEDLPKSRKSFKILR